ncbi:MAG TPA: TadE family protein [Armatimonadota bacterium]|jgi:Flp pilus assembly protein TadG
MTLTAYDNRGRRGAGRGAAIVEFVIVSALLIFLLFGIMEMGFMLSNSATVTMTAHQGARAAALRGTSAAVTAAVNNAAAPLRHSTDPTYLSYVTKSRQAADAAWSDWTPGTAPPGGTDAQIQVIVTYKYDYITGSLLGSIGNLLGGGGGSTSSRTLTGTAIMRYGG